MPFLQVQHPDEPEGSVKIAYDVHGDARAPGAQWMVFVAGVCAPRGMWAPQLKGLGGDATGPVAAITIDNRGVGESDLVPEATRYSTDRMASDALAVIDHVLAHYGLNHAAAAAATTTPVVAAAAAATPIAAAAAATTAPVVAAAAATIAAAAAATTPVAAAAAAATAATATAATVSVTAAAVAASAPVRLHVVGHSLGSMIASKLAARLARDRAGPRLASLTLLSGSLGGVHMAPPITCRLVATLPLLLNAGTPARRAKADLKCHFTDAWLDAPDAESADADDDALLTAPSGGGGGLRRRESVFLQTMTTDDSPPLRRVPSRRNTLTDEYVELSLAQRRFEPDVKAALEKTEAGQLRAVWMHSLRPRDVAAIRRALRVSGGRGRVAVVHGVEDAVAGVRAGEALAARLCARDHTAQTMTQDSTKDTNPKKDHLVTWTPLSGAHFITRENEEEVNATLRAQLAGALAPPTKADEYGAHEAREAAAGGADYADAMKDDDALATERAAAAAAASTSKRTAAVVSSISAWLALLLLLAVVLASFLAPGGGGGAPRVGALADAVDTNSTAAWRARLAAEEEGAEKDANSTAAWLSRVSRVDGNDARGDKAMDVLTNSTAAWHTRVAAVVDVSVSAMM